MKRMRTTVQCTRLGERLRQINQLTLNSTVGLVAVIVIVTGFFLNLNSVIAENRIMATVLADNASASLLFEDERVALELLQTLRHSSDIRVAAIYDEDGNPFAAYAASGHDVPASLGKPSDEISLGIWNIELWQSVLHQGRLLGHLYLHIDLAVLYGQMLWQILITLVAAVTALFIGRLLLERLSASVLQPLSDLAGVMERVSEQGDYGIRTQPSHIMELDTLSKGFNNMLEQIQVHEASLAAHRDRLEEEVAARTLQLQLAKDEAERANQAKSDFLSNMSHELRTPMNAILGFGQILEYDDTLHEENRDNVHEILKAGNHLLELINEVLDLAKVESGRIELSLEQIEVGPLVEECLNLVSPLADKRDIRLSHAGLVGTVRADRTRFKQVLLNLLSNAIKYNRTGGSVQINAQPEGTDRLRIGVTDTGPGIPTERLAELFQPFHRLDAENSEIEGTGIGLTLTRRIVELMGGKVAVESEVGTGSTFWIELPLEAAAAPDYDHEQATAVSATPIQGDEVTRHTVLYIEDNPANLKLVTHLLGRRRHIHLLTAHTPELGIELAWAHRPVLILMDINMPGMDGYQVLKVFKTDATTKAIPVIAITANAMPRDIRRGKAAGFDDYLTKPINVAKFFDTLDRYLPNRAESQV